MSHDLKMYLPAAGHHWALPFYDIITRASGVDAARRQFVADVKIGSGQRILDVGCGTGTLAIAMKSIVSDTDVVGLDPDPGALQRASRKAERAGVRIAFDRGSADHLPYANASFDRVVSSFMFHHLPADLKLPALREMRRVLGPGGALHLIDFGGPASAARGLRGWFLSRNRYTRHNFGDFIPKLLTEAGFSAVALIRQRMVMAGPIAHYQAVEE